MEEFRRLRPIQNDLRGSEHSSRLFYDHLCFSYRLLTSPLRYVLLRGWTLRDIKKYWWTLPFRAAQAVR